MKIAFCADVHLGNHKNGQRQGGDMETGMNARCREVLASLTAAAQVASDEGAELLVVCGDLFDKANPPPQMLAAAQRALSGVPAVLLMGNHDRWSNGPGDHALGPLAPIATVAETPQAVPLSGGWVLLLVPFHPGPPAAWFADAVIAAIADIPAGHKDDKRLLAFHCGVEDAHTNEFLKGHGVEAAFVSKVMDEHSIVYSFAGDWHDHAHWEEECLMQCGTLAPTGWDNAGVDGYGTVCLFDSDSNPYVEVVEVAGPRFVDVAGKGARPMLESLQENGCTTYARWTAKEATMVEAKATLEAWVTEGLIAGFKLRMNDEQAEEVARTAAKEAGKASTFDEALADYVAKMPMPPGIASKEIHALAKQYLGG